MDTIVEPRGPGQRPLRGLLPALGILCALAAPGAANADVVTDWNWIATRAVAAALPAERATPALQTAIVQTAVYDAVFAIDGSYRPLLARVAHNTRGASREAAVVAAAYKTLVALVPSQKPTLDSQYAASLAALPAGTAKERGIAIGTEVATRVLAARANDGRMVDVPWSYGSLPGGYQPTSPTPPPTPVTPWLAKVKPLVLKKPAQFRPEGPAPLDSLTYANDLEETALLGRKDSPARTQYDTNLAKAHTMPPPLFWGNNLHAFTVAQNLTLTENARLLAQLWVSVSDAAIACWDAKYYFNSWRPFTAIRNADLDGNDDTVADPLWEPQEVTPPHPEYPAAHGCFTGAVTETLRRFFGTRRLPLTIVATAPVAGVPTTFTYQYRYLDDFANDVLDARVFGGMHFRSSNEDGLDLGQRVARYVDRNAFQRERGKGHSHR